MGPSTLANRFGIRKNELKGNVIIMNFFSKKKAVEDYAPLSEGQEAHWEVNKNILLQTKLCNDKNLKKIAHKI